MSAESKDNKVIEMVVRDGTNVKSYSYEEALDMTGDY